MRQCLKDATEQVISAPDGHRMHVDVDEWTAEIIVPEISERIDELNNQNYRVLTECHETKRTAVVDSSID